MILDNFKILVCLPVHNLKPSFQDRVTFDRLVAQLIVFLSRAVQLSLNLAEQMNRAG